VEEDVLWLWRGAAIMTSMIHARRSFPAIRHAFFRRLSGIAALSFPAIALAAPAQTPAIPSPKSAAPTVIVVGFVGGFVRHDDDRHSEVQVVRRLSEEDLPGLHAEVFENRHTDEARRVVFHWLDTDGDGHISAEEKQNARIILFGHSWGGWAAIRLARELDRQGIPVAMTIEVDGINRLSGNDCLIPPNVAAAVNFYQTRGLLHGCRAIRAADPNRTRIVGNYRFAYTSQPSECRSISWANRHFFKTHEAMDCDPQVRSQVENQIDALVQSSIPVPSVAGGAELATGSPHP
jgi:hypothetical protein